LQLHPSSLAQPLQSLLTLQVLPFCALLLSWLLLSFVVQSSQALLSTEQVLAIA